MSKYSAVEVGSNMAKRPYLQAIFIFIPAFILVGSLENHQSVWFICNTALLFFALSNPLLGGFDSRNKWYFPWSILMFLPLGFLLTYLTQIRLDVDLLQDFPKRMQLTLAIVAFVLVHIIVFVFRTIKKFMDAN